MAKANARLEAARTAYREALDAARANPTPEAWARLLTAGKELSTAEDPRPRSRRGRRPQPRPPLETTADPADPGGSIEGLD